MTNLDRLKEMDAEQASRLIFQMICKYQTTYFPCTLCQKLLKNAFYYKHEKLSYFTRGSTVTSTSHSCNNGKTEYWLQYNSLGRTGNGKSGYAVETKEGKRLKSHLP